MPDILRTSIIQSKRSSFIIELVKHEIGSRYVEVKQIIHANDSTGKVQTIKITPLVLSDIIKELTIFQKQIATEELDGKKHKLSTERQAELIRRYLIGVEISALCTQFNCSKPTVVEILQEACIEIVSNRIPSIYFKRFSNKKKK